MLLSRSSKISYAFSIWLSRVLADFKNSVLFYLFQKLTFDLCSHLIVIIFTLFHRSSEQNELYYYLLKLRVACAFFYQHVIP